MIVVCSQCTARLQIDDAKVPAHSFTVRCPKCHNAITAQPPNAGAREKDQNTRKSSDQTALNSSSDVDAGEALRTLMTLLHRAGAGLPINEKQRSSAAGASRLSWERRRALVCTSVPGLRKAIARGLGAEYEVLIAENTSQALEYLREERMDVVMLDPEFEAAEGGAAFVGSEINFMRPAERRRRFFVEISNAARTADAHAAFISNVNLIVNPADIETLPRVLEQSLRDFNHLYHNFNAALGLAPL
jgi:predicted Zn finger-like uncharacterized protein